MASGARIFDAFPTDDALASHLAAAVGVHKNLRSVAVGLQTAGGRMFAATDENGRLCSGGVAQARMPASCLAKPLTAALAAEAVASKQIEWDTQISDVLAMTGALKRTLARITIGQLLDHTHGLDGSDIERAPLTGAGFLDATALCEQLAKSPLSEPGELYSYGEVGSFLAGAALERLSGKRYGQLLGTSELIPSDGQERAETACPARGGGFELTLSQWLSFLDCHLQIDRMSASVTRLQCCLTDLRSAPVALPGWSATGQAATRGWKYFGDGWFGDNATLADRSCLLRFNPQQAIAIALTAAGKGAFPALGTLFGAALPEFANLLPPRLLIERERETLQVDQYVGTYAQARMRIEVAATSANSLSLAIPAYEAGREAQRLKPANNQIFIPERRNHPELSFVQFVSSAGSGRFNYLWNGDQLWRRV